MPPIVTLTTDFGTRDPYAAAVKGVLLARCPGVRVVDLTHEIAPRDIVEGALFLAQAAPWYPAGTVHLAVVDPGVGTGRRPLAAQAGGHFFVAPDNGLLELVLRRLRARRGRRGSDRTPRQRAAGERHLSRPRRLCPGRRGPRLRAPARRASGPRPAPLPRSAFRGPRASPARCAARSSTSTASAT